MHLKYAGSADGAEQGLWGRLGGSQDVVNGKILDNIAE